MYLFLEAGFTTRSPNWGFLFSTGFLAVLGQNHGKIIDSNRAVLASQAFGKTMKKNIIWILSILAIASIPFIVESKTVYIADHTELEVNVEKTIWTKDELVQYVTDEANYYGVNPDMAVRVMLCEAPIYNGVYDVNDSQSRIRYTEGQIKRNPSWGNVGERENSFGIWQYHLPAHDMTQEEASSVKLSTLKAMKDLKKNPKQWTCYKKI